MWPSTGATSRFGRPLLRPPPTRDPSSSPLSVVSSLSLSSRSIYLRHNPSSLLVPSSSQIMMILSTTLQPLLLPLVSVFLFVCSSPLAGSSPVESPSTGTPHYPNTMKIPAGVPSPQELIRWASKAPSRGDGERLRWSSGAPTHHDHDRYATSMSNFDDLSKEVPSQWHTTTEADRRHPARPKQFQLLAGDDAPYYLRNKTLRIDPETFHIRFFTMGKILRVHFAHDLDNGKLLVDNFPVSDLEL